MIPRRTTSWKTSSQRRNHGRSINSTGSGSGGNYQFAQQLSPYKTTTSLRGIGNSRNSSAAASVRAGSRGVASSGFRSAMNDPTTSRNGEMPNLTKNGRGLTGERKVSKTDVGVRGRISDGDGENDDSMGALGLDDDYDLGLDDDVDNILSSIEGITSSGGKCNNNPTNEMKGATKNSEENHLSQTETDCHDNFELQDVWNFNDDEKKSDTPKFPGSNYSEDMHISPVDFGANVQTNKPLDNRVHNVETTDEDEDNDHALFEDDEEDDTLFSDGDATRQHKIMMQAEEGPMFSSGFDDSALRSSQMSNGQSIPIAGPSFRRNSGALDNDEGLESVTEEVEHHMSVSINNTASNEIHSALIQQQIPIASRTPPRGNSSCGPPKKIIPSYSKPDPVDDTAPQPPPQSNIHCGGNASSYIPGAVAEKKEDRKQQNTTYDSPPSPKEDPSPENILDEVHQLNQEDETLSTVTDPTESPFIYTYKKHGDDDSVSQITSSVACSYGSSYLQNIPMSVGSNAKSSLKRPISNGLSWMGGNTTGSRMNHRKGGSFGRERGRRSSASSSPFMGNDYNGGGSGSGGGTGLDIDNDDPANDGRASLDEIQFALNADYKPGRNHRSRRTQGRVNCSSSVTSGAGSCDDLSNGDSRQTGSARHRRSVPEYSDGGSNVSALGIGGVSCAGQSVSGATSVSESTKSSSRGFFQGLTMLFLKAQHHGSRFFFPTSAAVTQRKKYDRSDSLDDILLEEGATTLPHRKRNASRNGNGKRVEDEDEIDYFSKVMSVTSHDNSQASNSRQSKKRNNGSWGGNTIRLGGAFLAMTASLTIYRMAVDGDDNKLFPSNMAGPDVLIRTRFNLFSSKAKESAGGGGNKNALDPRASNKVLVFDEVTGAMVEQNKVIIVQGENQALDNNGLKQPIENNILLSEDQNQMKSVSPLSNQQPLEIQQEIEFNPGEPNESNNFLRQDRSQIVTKNVQRWQLPSSLEVLANVDALPFQRGIDLPFYWHVPRSGGGTVNDVLGSCLRLTLAADAGGSGGHGQDETLKVLTFSRQVSYVNVDTSSHQGIQRAKTLDLVASGLSDVVISPLLHEASTLFTPTRRGRMFSVFRNPIERAVSLFYFIQDTQWKQPSTRNDQFAEISIEDFYRGGFAENNWMTRFLTDELTKGELTNDDLEIAKDILRQKCLVGLLEEKGETFERMLKYFGWTPRNSSEKECLERKLQWAWPMKHRHVTVEEGSEAWYLIGDENKFDLELYDYAKELFQQQRSLFES